MENASKALLIAGGMILAILLLTFFIASYSNMSRQTSRIYETMSKSEITEFNQSYMNYDGRNNLTAQDVKTIINMNISNIDNGKMGVDIVLIDSEHTSGYTDDELENYDVFKNLSYSYRCVVEYGDVAHGTQEYVKTIHINAN